MVSAVGHDIKRLKRVRIQNISLGDLPEGEWRTMTQQEKNALFASIGLGIEHS